MYIFLFVYGMQSRWNESKTFLQVAKAYFEKAGKIKRSDRVGVSVSSRD